jgi:DNA-binding NarL/FixJ family response regulator
LYRDGLVGILRQSEHIDVVSAAATLATALEYAEAHRPEIVLLDCTVAEGGLAVSAIMRASPGARIVALAVADTPAEVIPWAEAGIAGYVTRNDSAEDLVLIIESVARGEMPCSPGIAAHLLQRVAHLAAGRPREGQADLTPREQEVVALIEQGLSNKEIARHLLIEVSTVKNHVHHILEKLQARGRSVAAVRARNLAFPARATLSQRGAPIGLASSS